jgi:3-oxoacyl-[acyl-carrier protein] reductase
MTRRLSGKVALVTGASRGVGRAIAQALAKEGADLIVTSTREGGTDSLSRELAAFGVRCEGVACDVADPRQVDALVTRASAAGGVDLLVNNAGTVVRKPVREMSDADFDRVLAVNLSGPFYLVRRLLPSMLKKGYGRILNISSISSTMGTPTLTGYCASKWGLNGFTRALAEELRGTGVFAAAVLPGSVDTDMLKGSGFPPTMTPAEVAEVVRYLCAEAPAPLHGSLVEVFG